MPVYLIDVNLPYYFSLWRDENFLFVRDLNDEWKDSEIWQHALENNLIIVTKDTDFFDRVMVSKTHPKVIHLCFGNTLMREFFSIMERYGRRLFHSTTNTKLSEYIKIKL